MLDKMLANIGKSHTTSKMVDFAKKQGSTIGQTTSTLYKLKQQRRVRA